MYTKWMHSYLNTEKKYYGSLKDKIYWQMKDMILRGEIRLGQRVIEEEIATRLEVSRTPVREAMHLLTAEGFLITVPQKGSYCREMSEQEIRNLLDVRSSLEILAVAEFIENAEPMHMDHLETVNERMRAAVASQDYALCNQLDFKFHGALASGGGNTFLIDLLERVGEMVQLIRLKETELDALDKNVNAVEDHTMIIAALRRKNTDESIRYVQKNIDHMKSNIGL